MKIVTAAEMRSIDRRTEELGIPGIILMENAAHRVVEYLEQRLAPLRGQRMVVLCGKGNNGGDGLAIARQLFTRVHPRSLDVLLACRPEELNGNAAANYRMYEACGGTVRFEIEPEMQAASLVVDALLGSGLNGAARGKGLEWIRAINSGFRGARVVAVDVPSGMPSDTGEPSGEFARADATVTFTAPRLCHVLAPNRNHVGELRVGPIGTPASMIEQSATIRLALVTPNTFRELLAPRKPDGNKGSYGHVLMVAGSAGKTGAAAMSGLGALHAGAGLVTVASAPQAIPAIAAYSPELMTEALPEDALGKVRHLMEKLTVLAIGPGIGTSDETARMVRELFATCDKPMVVDADALNNLADGQWPDRKAGLRILTPHPGEMARLTGTSVKDVQADRIGCARRFATERDVILVLKGECTLVAFPDGQVWVNPTGSPSMATGGTGDVLTGLTAGFVAQFPMRPREAVAAAVYLHGKAGQLGAAEIGEQPFIATDIFRMLPQAIREARNADDPYSL